MRTADQHGNPARAGAHPADTDRRGPRPLRLAAGSRRVRRTPSPASETRRAHRAAAAPRPPLPGHRPRPGPRRHGAGRAASRAAGDHSGRLRAAGGKHHEGAGGPVRPSRASKRPRPPPPPHVCSTAGSRPAVRPRRRWLDSSCWTSRTRPPSTCTPSGGRRCGHPAPNGPGRTHGRNGPTPRQHAPCSPGRLHRNRWPLADDPAGLRRRRRR